ncbi:MAG: hypothetical protein ACOYMN_16300 [Roseimicrobium sp.]
MPFWNRPVFLHALLVASGMAFGAGVMWIVRPAAPLVQEVMPARPSGSHWGEPAYAPRNTTGSQQTGTELNTSESIQAALQKGLSIGSELEKLEYYRGLFKGWAEKDPEGALAYAKAHFPEGLLKSETIGIAINKWAAKDPRSAWNWTEENLTGNLRDQAQNDVMIGWTRQSPEEASQWLSSTGSTSQALHAAIARTWSERDPLSALQWADEIASPQLRKATSALVANALALDKPDAALALLPTRPDLAPIIAQQVAHNGDPDRLLEPIQQMSEGPAKDQTWAAFMRALAASNPTKATQSLALVTDPQLRRELVETIGTTWSAMEPERALAWLNTLPANESTDGYIGAFNSWAATDPVGLRQYVDAHPKPMPTMDQARLSLADVYSDTSIADSLNLSLALSSPANRDDALAHYYRKWRKVDDATAQDWLQKNWSSLPVSAQRRLTIEQTRPVVTK